MIDSIYNNDSSQLKEDFLNKKLINKKNRKYKNNKNRNKRKTIFQ